MLRWTYASRRATVGFVQQWRCQRCQSSITTPGSQLSPALLARAEHLAAEHARLSEQLSNQFDQDVAKKAGELSATAQALNHWSSAQKNLAELQRWLSDPATDEELRSLAKDEIETASTDLAARTGQLQTSLIPAHPFANLSCLMEIRPGAGGSEAGLFAGDLMRMYQAFCKNHRLPCNVLKLDEDPTQGSNQLQEVVLEIDDAGTYGTFRCEAGVHRVQRVPATEKQGRTHTSAVSVIVLPSFANDGSEELGEKSFDDPTSDYYISPQEVRIDVMRASGAGGQHVNKTESAVRLTHLPTNTVVAMQDSRSQSSNRQKAWQILRAKLAQARREAREAEMAQLRVSVVGVARTGRGDKIRTYNWNQQRVTDHRSGISMHHLDDVLQGGDSLGKIMDSVRDWLRDEDIKALIANEEATAARSAKANKSS